MKKLFLIAAAFVGVIAVAKAQDPSNSSTTTTTTTTTTTMNQDQDESASSGGGGNGLYLGVQYLPTFTHFDVNEVEGGVYKTHFVLGHGWGGIVGVNLSDHFGLQGEVLYNALSQKYTDENNIERRINLNYVNIPLLMVFNTDVNKPVNLNLVVGPQVGLNIGSEVKSDGGEVDTVGAVVAVKSGDLGVAYGAGLDFGLGSNVQLGVGYRGVLGLVDISDDSNSSTTNQYYVLDRAHVSTYAGYIALKFKL